MAPESGAAASLTVDPVQFAAMMEELKQLKEKDAENRKALQQLREQQGKKGKVSKTSPRQQQAEKSSPNDTSGEEDAEDDGMFPVCQYLFPCLSFGSLPSNQARAKASNRKRSPTRLSKSETPSRLNNKNKKTTSSQARAPKKKRIVYSVNRTELNRELGLSHQGVCDIKATIRNLVGKQLDFTVSYREHVKHNKALLDGAENYLHTHLRNKGKPVEKAHISKLVMTMCQDGKKNQAATEDYAEVGLVRWQYQVIKAEYPNLKWPKIKELVRDGKIAKPKSRRILNKEDIEDEDDGEGFEEFMKNYEPELYSDLEDEEEEEGDADDDDSDPSTDKPSRPTPAKKPTPQTPTPAPSKGKEPQRQPLEPTTRQSVSISPSTGPMRLFSKGGSRLNGPNGPSRVVPSGRDSPGQSTETTARLVTPLKRPITIQQASSSTAETSELPESSVSKKQKKCHQLDQVPVETVSGATVSSSTKPVGNESTSRPTVSRKTLGPRVTPAPPIKQTFDVLVVSTYANEFVEDVLVKIRKVYMESFETFLNVLLRSSYILQTSDVIEYTPARGVASGTPVWRIVSTEEEFRDMLKLGNDHVHIRISQSVSSLFPSLKSTNHIPLPLPFLLFLTHTQQDNPFSEFAGETLDELFNTNLQNSNPVYHDSGPISVGHDYPIGQPQTSYSMYMMNQEGFDVTGLSPDGKHDGSKDVDSFTDGKQPGGDDNSEEMVHDSQSTIH